MQFPGFGGTPYRYMAPVFNKKLTDVKASFRMRRRYFRG